MNTDEVYKNLLERMRNKPPKSDPTRLVKGDDFKIVGGQDVTNHTWPFLVNIGNFCMGSIIGKCSQFNLGFDLDRFEFIFGLVHKL